MKQQADKDRVVIFDTTLRDGEQSPGATMTHEWPREFMIRLHTPETFVTIFNGLQWMQPGQNMIIFVVLSK